MVAHSETIVCGAQPLGRKLAYPQTEPPLFPKAARKELQTVGNCVGVIPLPREFTLITNGK
jgi:hypothetical protein